MDQRGNNTNIELGEVGGLVGSMGGDTINAALSNASATGAMSVTTKNFYDTDGNKNNYNIYSIGGLLGSADRLDASTISATNSVDVKGDTIDSVGGVIGQSYRGTYNGMTRTGNITLNPADPTTDQYSEVYSVGGLIGNSENDTIANATAAGTITLGTADAPMGNAGKVGGAIGSAYGTNIDTTVSSVAIEAANVSQGNNFGGLVGENCGYTDSIYKLSVGYYEYNADDAVLADQYNTAKATYLARANVIALISQGYALSDNSWSNSGSGQYRISLEMVKPNVEFGDITNSSASGSVIAPNISRVGGLVGYNYLDGDSGATITNSHASGEVKGLGNVGGLVGSNEGGNITTSYASGKVTGTTENVGGLIGYNVQGIIIDSHATGSVTGNDFTGGLVGFHESYDEYGNISGSYATGAVTGHIRVGGLIGDTINQGNAITSISESYATGDVEGRSYIGGLVGRNHVGVRVIDSYATGDVVSTHGTSGGLVGKNDGYIETSYAQGKVSSANGSEIGGLAGDNFGSIIDSYATGEVSSAGGWAVGGLVGYQYKDMPDAILSGSYATGKVTGDEAVGGLVGGSDDTNIINSYATGEVIGNTQVGGLAGYFAKYNLGSVFMEKSYATGEVTGTDQIGGLIGYTNIADIENVFATGDVTNTSAASTKTGALIGMSVNGSVTTSYASGLITVGADTSANLGGLIGANDDSGTTVSDSFYNKTLNVGKSDEVASGKTTAELKSTSTFDENNWDIAVDSTLIDMYPRLAASGSDTVWIINPAAIGAAAAAELAAQQAAAAAAELAAQQAAAAAAELAAQQAAAAAAELAAQQAAAAAAELAAQQAAAAAAELAAQQAAAAAAELAAQQAAAAAAELAAQQAAAENTQIEKVITTIVNNTINNVNLPKDVLVPKVNLGQNMPILPMTQTVQSSPIMQNLAQKLGVNQGEQLSLVSTTLEGQSTERITLDELKNLSKDSNNSNSEGNTPLETRVAVGDNSIIELVNGGMTLPDGVDQEFYVVKNKKNKK